MNQRSRTRATLSAALFAGLASGAEAQPLLAHETLDLHLGRLIAVLALSTGLAIAAALILKRATKGRFKFAARPWLSNAGADAVAVLETRRLGLHGDVCRLAYRNREYLIVVSAGGATLLKEIETAGERTP